MVHAAGERDEQVLAFGEGVVGADEIGQLHRRLGIVDRLVRLVVEDEVHVRAARRGLPILDVELHLEVLGLVGGDRLILGGRLDRHLGHLLRRVGRGAGADRHVRHARAGAAARALPTPRGAEAARALPTRRAAGAGAAASGAARSHRTRPCQRAT